ncbi:MAG: GSCFA domain-containing protein [Bacteroidales bacterium]|nr:GSCFA domain-containing protein [Bacteroidales bacterium]
MEELKLQTPVPVGRSRVEVSPDDKICVLGSCFADNIGEKMAELGFNACVNPFGTLYNPVSVCNSVSRLASGIPFTEDECVEMGSGAGLVCSFSHHTSFARGTAEEFLSHANTSLAAASKAWNEAGKVIITLGTAWCFEYIPTGEIVSNCLKIDQKLFRRKRLSVQETSVLLRNLVGRNPGKEFIFTVSPIRHLKDGAHGNQLSKSILILAVEDVCNAFPERCEYFPAYEILLDELRDYRFYAEDLVHPSQQAVSLIWNRFVDFAVPQSCLSGLEARWKEARRSRHRNIH